MLQYKGYTGYVEYDDDAQCLHGEVLGLADVITFEADAAADVEREFRESIDDYLEFCKELGRKPEKPLSGKFNLRLGSELHRRAAAKARAAGKSLNAYIADLVKDDTGNLAV